MATQAQSDYSVRFSSDVARVVVCETPSGRIEFTVDAAADGARSICLEHHAANAQRSPHYDHAFQSARRFLESCGYEVEVYGQ